MGPGEIVFDVETLPGNNFTWKGITDRMLPLSFLCVNLSRVFILGTLISKMEFVVTK